MSKRRDRKNTIPAVLSELDPVLLRRLLERHPGARPYLPKRSRPIDIERVGQALINPPHDGSLAKLVRDVTALAELADAHYHDLLFGYVKQCRILPSTTPTTADLAAILLLEREDLFRQAYAERVVREHSSFVSYYPTEEGVPEVKTALERVLVQMGKLIDASLVASGRCAGARLYAFNTDDGFTLVVSRPETKQRVSTVVESGDREQVEFHREGFDILHYRAVTGELRTHTKLKSDLNLYLGLLGEHVFGDADLYSSTSIEANLDLAPLREGSEALRCEDVPELREVRLTALAWRYLPPLSLTTRLTSKKDLIDEMRLAGVTVPRDTSLTTVTLRFEFLDGRESSARATAPNKLTLSHDADHEVICAFLRQRGIMLEPKESQIEFADAVLEAR